MSNFMHIRGIFHLWISCYYHYITSLLEILKDLFGRKEVIFIRTLRDLYSIIELKKKESFIHRPYIAVQVYSDGRQASVRLPGRAWPCIKFEPVDCNNMAHVAVAYPEAPSYINYGKMKTLPLDTKIVDLKKHFRNGYEIDEVVSALLKFRG